MIKDFEKEPTYSKIHIVFYRSLPKDLLEKIAKNENLVSRILSVKEMYFGLYFTDESVFHLN